jgi:hypothetical protein
MKKRNSDGTIQTTRPTQMSVSAILPGDENRFVRIQPSTPVLATGAGNSFAGASRRYTRSAAAMAQRSTMRIR